MFDPLGVTGLPSSTWSPLRAAPHPVRRSQRRRDPRPHRCRGQDPGDRFWRGQAEQLLAAMLYTAANTDGHTMRHVVRWVLDLDRPGDDNGGTLAPLVRLLTDHDDPQVALAAKQVQGWLHGQWSSDPRTTSSVYATARNAVWPWADPAIADSAEDCQLTLDWLLAGNNTLYLVAPLGDETRIGLVFAAVLHDLISEAFTATTARRAARPASARRLRRSGQHAAAKAAAMGSHRQRSGYPTRHRVAVQGTARHHLRPRRRQRPDQPPEQTVLSQRADRHDAPSTT